MDKILKLYTYVNGVNDTPFPYADGEPIEIGSFRYDAKRMGGAPIITASVNYPTCLDEEWSENVYAEFNGEKYYLKQTPTSSYDNEDVLYKHDLELVSERIILDNVYFFDAVSNASQTDDKPLSNSTKVVFFGDIREFAGRLQQSLNFSGIDYTVVVDDEIESEEKLMSFEDAFFSNVLQEIYNTYKVPYYFNTYVDDGGVRHREIHIGYAKSDVVVPTLSYGVDNALLSITKNNANYKIVNRVTGTGSSENIPFYYPNNSPKGEIAVDTTSTSATFTIIDGEAFSNEVAIGDVVAYGSGSASGVSMMVSDDGNKWTSYNGEALSIAIVNMKPTQKWFSYTFQVNEGGKVKIGGNITIDGGDTRDITEFLSFAEINNRHGKHRVSIEDGYIDCDRLDSGSHTLYMGFSFPYLGRVNYTVSASFGTEMASWWYNKTQDKETSLAKMGLAYSGILASGDTITQRLVKYINTSQNLMPSIYRTSNGDERFYNAINDKYPFAYVAGYELQGGEYVDDSNLVQNDSYKDEEGVYYEFSHPYVAGKPKEHIVTAEDIKPSIAGMEYNGVRIDKFLDFAYDNNDSDETYEDEDGNTYFKHSYFFAKLPPLGFNLFDHAIENQPMTISFTSGNCGACNFEIAVDEDTQKNTVRVDESGYVVKDEDGNVVCGVNGDVEFQDIQQDTTDHSVWIALKKEESTYGILMPQEAYRPTTDDTFVILGINLPYEYIKHAEKKLEAELIKYLKDNNDEKFTFSIGFSRIYFEENEIHDQLSENSKIAIMYNGHRYDLYVSSFSYSMSEGDVLPQITVELDETLKISQNAIQNAISEVKSELGRALGNIDVVGATTPYFIRKDADDEAQGRINFRKGVKFGEGGKVEILDNNSAKLTIEYLEVTKKASFTSLEIQEKTHVGGQILVTPAAINCGEVEEFDDYYRCYFQTKGVEGDEIFNQYAVGDQAICQTYNAWGSRYYWRLVTGVGEDYIDLSKVEGEYDEDSDAPSEGDKIIQLGNQVDETRQNAIVIAAYGEGSPYIIQYKGINAFEIPDDKVVTKLSSTENIFTGTVHMKTGSDGFEGMEGLPEFIQESVGEIGGQNLLRNSGFTGDYLSKDLADQSVLDTVDEMFNPPLVHWNDAETPAVNATVQDSTVSASGKEVVLEAGSITQTLFQNIILGESYVLSFKAKGTTLDYSVGGVSKTIELTSEWVDYVEKFVATTRGEVFAISNATCSLCDLQLERGTMATPWGNSPFDNSSDLTYYQSLKYLSQAMAQGSTTIGGGLVLTNHIKVGNYANGEMTEETAGMNGTYNEPSDVAFWAGGSASQALNAIAETGVDESNFAVSHGGKVVMNDAKVRGEIHATKGSIGGDNTTIDEDGTIKTKAIELSDYVVYKYKSIQEVCNGGEISSTYTLPSNAPSYISYKPSEHHPSLEPVLTIPSEYEAGRTITIASSPRLARMDSNLTLDGTFYLSIIDEESGKSHISTSLVLLGGKIELYYDGGYWIVLSPIGTNILNNG